MKRYQRQVILPQIKEDGQAALAKAKVLIVGAGGLGTPAAQYLVSAGIGEVCIIDGDTIDLTNLHRQVLFTESDIDLKKADVLRDKLLLSNPNVKVTSISQFLTKEIAVNCFEQFDVIVDGTDNFSAKYLINDAATYFGKPVVYAAISQFEGQLSVFWQKHGPCYRCLYPDVPKSKIMNCAESGVLGALPGMFGAMQAMECLKLILYRHKSTNPRPLIGTMAVFDFGYNSFHTFNVSRRQTCFCASDSFDLDQIQDWKDDLCSIETSLTHAASFGHVSSADLILDVRTSEEWENFHIKGSIHWPLDMIENGVCPNIANDAFIYCVCLSGKRARRAQELLKNSGFTNVKYILESINEHSF